MTASVISIADENTDRNQIFEGCDDLTIYAPAGSYAEKYAKSHGFDVIIMKLD